MIETRFPTASAADVGAGLTSPDNVFADDGVYATALPGKNLTLGSRYTNFGFNKIIATGSAIVKVELIYEWKASTNTSVATARIRASVGGTDLTNHDDATEPAGDTVNTYDITGEHAWVRDDLIDSNFAVELHALQGSSSTAVTFSFDYIQVRVTFTKAVHAFNNYMALSGGGGLCFSERIR